MSRYYMGPLDRASWLRFLRAHIYGLELDMHSLNVIPKESDIIREAVAQLRGRLAAIEEYDIYCLPEDILARINADHRRI